MKHWIRLGYLDRINYYFSSIEFLFIYVYESFFKRILIFYVFSVFAEKNCKIDLTNGLKEMDKIAENLSIFRIQLWNLIEKWRLFKKSVFRIKNK